MLVYKDINLEELAADPDYILDIADSALDNIDDKVMKPYAGHMYERISSAKWDDPEFSDYIGINIIKGDMNEVVLTWSTPNMDTYGIVVSSRGPYNFEDSIIVDVEFFDSFNSVKSWARVEEP